MQTNKRRYSYRVVLLIGIVIATLSGFGFTAADSTKMKPMGVSNPDVVTNDGASNGASASAGATTGTRKKYHARVEFCTS